jgi:hypothetical protein
MHLPHTLALLAILSLPVAAMANPVPISGTGTSGLSNNDPNWTVTTPGGVTTQGITISPNPGWGAQPSFNATPGATNWINASGSSSSADAAGDYTYTTTFNLSGLNLASVDIFGGWASDNNSELFLNGVEIGSIPYAGSYNSFENFNITSGFNSGLNVLSIIVTNGNGGSDLDGPTGLIAQVSGTANPITATPEPSSLALLGTGLLSLFGVARRKFRA